MSGMKPIFLVEEQNESYYETPNPYVMPPSCGVNLLELFRYAKETGKKLVELSKEEVAAFSRK